MCEIFGVRNGCAGFSVCEICDMRNLDVRKMDVRDFICMYVSFINLFRTSRKISNVMSLFLIDSGLTRVV